MAIEYKLSYTASEIENKLGQIDNKLDASALDSAIDAALTEAKESGEFKGEQGSSGIYLGSGDMPEDCNVQIDPDGEPIEVYSKEEADSLLQNKIALWKPNTEYKVGDLVIARGESLYRKGFHNRDCIFKCIQAHISADIFIAQDEKNKWKEQTSFYATSSEKADRDDRGNIINETYATKEELSNGLASIDLSSIKSVDFSIKKLAPAATFEIEPNMFCMAMTGGETCLGYYNKDNTAIATDIGTSIFFSTETNTQADAWATEDDFQWWYRVASLYQTSGGLLSLPFKSRNDALIKNAYLKNNHASLEVWVYILKQG